MESDSKKKAVFISCFGAYENRLKPFVELLREKGYETKYLYADYDHAKKTHYKSLQEDSLPIHVTSYKKNMSLARLYSHYIFSCRVDRYIREYKPDFIYCMIPPNSLTKKMAKYRKNNKESRLLFDVYDFWPESFPYSKGSKFLSYPFRLWGDLRKKNISQADLILSVSEEGKAFLQAEAPENRVDALKPVVPAGEMPHYKPDEEVMSFCYLGMINHITDIEFGVKLLGQIAKHKRTILHIIGEGENLDDFRTRLANEGIEVICHGCIFEQEEKNKIFELCNMGLNIPREEIDSTMSLKAIDYMRVGLPFLNTAHGEIRAIVLEDQVGLDVQDGIEKASEKILEMSKEDFLRMHNNSVRSYQKRFLDQDYEGLFSDIL